MPPSPEPTRDLTSRDQAPRDKALPAGGAPPGLLAGMRIRKKLLLLHTVFSAMLAVILALALRPAIKEIVARSEMSQAVHVLEVSLTELERLGDPGATIRSIDEGRVVLRSGTPAQLDLPPEVSGAALGAPRVPLPVSGGVGTATAAVFVPSGVVSYDEDGQAVVEGTLWTATVSIPEARDAVVQLYLLLIVALLAVYGLVAIALEMFVLPQQVYAPIRAILRADRAVREGDRDHELVPGAAIPADELGEIMRSRNDAITRVRDQERRLGDAFSRLEDVASDLKRKNHLLETARRNLEGADRLVSIGMMSAGIAHELNTPLSVAKGLTEKLERDPARGLTEPETRLLARVVGRLERLSESLLDFARAREPGRDPTSLREVVEEACTLVALDRDTASPGREVRLDNRVPAGVVALADADRMVQVFVNLIRNSVDAVRGEGLGAGVITITGAQTERDGARWAQVEVVDTGPGIDPEVLPRLFEPFVSTRLDAEGTGLGLAVADGIVREHGGTIIARDRPGRSGAVFEVMLPANEPDLLQKPPDNPDPNPEPALSDSSADPTTPRDPDA